MSSAGPTDFGPANQPPAQEAKAHVPTEGGDSAVSGWLAGLITTCATSPTRRLLVTVIGSTLWTVVTGIYVNIVTQSGSFSASQAFRGLPFYSFLATTLFWFWINKRFLDVDEDIEKFRDDAYCRAYVRRARIKQYARDCDRNPGQLLTADQVLNELNVK
jgi:hypothetical protein